MRLRISIKTLYAPLFFTIRVKIEPQHIKYFKMSLKSVLLVLAIAATAHSQTANDFDFTAYRGCVRRLFDDICTNNIGFYEDLVEILAGCGAEVNARLVANYCARDEEAQGGIVCGTAESYPALLGMTLGTCGVAIGGGPCSSDCSNALMTIRNELGCCTNAFFNNTLYTSLAPALSYSLWSRCGVEQPNSTCEGALPYTLATNPTRECTPDELNGCRVSDQAIIQDAAPAGCEDIIRYNMARCSHLDGSEDRLCFDQLATDLTPITGTIPSIGTNCAPGTCSNACESTLQSFVDNRGCCVNTLYNSTYTTVLGLDGLVSSLQDGTLLDECGVKPPPLSCPPLSDGSLPLKSFGVMMLLPLIVTALLGNKI
jgi:hypothetical protein